MDRESYLMEHGSDILFEPSYDSGVVGRCEHCYEEIGAGWRHFQGKGCLLHAECALDYILNNFTSSRIVEAMGFAIGG